MPITHEDNIPSIFSYFPPKNGYIGILSIPHSGEDIPDEFREYITDDLTVLSRDVDFKVDELVDIGQLTENGIAVLVAHIHRTCVDLNRSEDICVLNWKSNSHGEKIVFKEPDERTIEVLTGKYYSPYYEMIKSSMNELAKVQKGTVTFIDLHSMPSKPTEYHLNINPNQKLQRPDFCVSDIEGLSCDKNFIDDVCMNLNSFSKWVTQNDPYFGGHVTRHVHATYKNKNNIQIEINRGIYMDEEKRVLNSELVSKLKPNLTAALLSVFKKYSS